MTALFLAGHVDMMGPSMDNGLKPGSKTKKTKSEESKTKGGGGGALLLDNERDDLPSGGTPGVGKKGESAASAASKKQKRFKYVHVLCGTCVLSYRASLQGSVGSSFLCLLHH